MNARTRVGARVSGILLSSRAVITAAVQAAFTIEHEEGRPVRRLRLDFSVAIEGTVIDALVSAVTGSTTTYCTTKGLVEVTRSGREIERVRFVSDAPVVALPIDVATEPMVLPAEAA